MIKRFYFTPRHCGNFILAFLYCGHSAGSSRNIRPKKSGKSADLHRVKEKLADAEKLAASSSFDKDDSSSTTTETSSIEADDKILVSIS